MGITDKITGRVKKAAGDLADDASLRREGRQEERKGEAKDELANANEKAEELGDDIRAAEKPLYLSMIEEVEPFEGARDLIADLKERGHTVVLASSAKGNEIEHYLDLLDARDLADAWTMSDDVEETKPSPDLVQAALQKAGEESGVMVGDTTWDVEAAKRAGVETITVMTGGFGEDELRESGAIAVFDSIGELRERISDTPLG